MNMIKIRQIAKSQGIQPKKLNKATLVKTIQKKEGNFDCFSSAWEGKCDQGNCLWRTDCLKQAVKAA